MDDNRMIQLKDMLKDDPENDFILYAIAKEYEKKENYDEALNKFLALKSKSPDYVGLYYHLGKLYEILEQPNEALSTYTEGIEKCKKAKDFHALSELNNAKTNLELDL